MNDNIAPPAEPVASRQRIVGRFLLVWLLGCLLVVLYIALVAILKGTPSWLDVIVFGGWVFVAGTWLLILPPLRSSPRAKRLVWGLGVAALALVLVFTALPWMLSPTNSLETTSGTVPFGLLIPDALNRLVVDVLAASNNRAATPGLIAGFLPSVTGSGLALACLALLWRVVYEGTTPYARRFWPWLADRWRRLEAVPFWVAVKRLAQGTALAFLLAIGLGLFLTGQPTRIVESAKYQIEGLELGRPPPISSLIMGGDGQSLFAITAGEVYRSTDGGESWHSTTPEPGFSIFRFPLLVQNSKVFFVRTNRTVVIWDESTETWQPASEGLPFNILWQTLALLNGDLYTLNGGGTYRSQDSGRTWQRLSEALPEGELMDFELVASPDDKGIIGHISNHLYHFDPTEAQWTLISSQPSDLPFADVLAVPESQRLVASNDMGISYSDDVGQTWQSAVIPEGFGTSLSLGRGFRPNSLIAWGTSGIFRSENGGVSWQATEETGRVRRMIALPASQTLFAEVNFGGWRRSTDGGNIWQALDGLESSYELREIVETPQGDKLFVATDAGVFRSTDRGLTWEPANRGLGAPSILTLAIGLNDAVFTTLDGGGLLRSIDNGTTWQPADQGLKDRIVRSLIITPDGHTLFAGTYNGLFQSRDNGFSWQPVGPPLDDYSVTTLLVGPDARTLFVGTFGAGIFRSSDLGATWVEAVQGIEGRWVNSLTVGPYGQKLFAATDEGVFRSSDNGTSWQLTAAGLDGETVNTLLVNSISGLLAGTNNGLYTYDDQRGVWRQIALSDSNIYSLATDPYNQQLWAGDFDGLHFVEFSLDNQPSNSYPMLWGGYAINAIMPRLEDRSIWVGTSKGLLRSYDGGNNWEEISITPQGLLVNDMAVSPEDGDLFLATPMGIYRSTDGGSSWQPANDGLSSFDVISLTTEAISSNIMATTDTNSSYFWEPSQLRWQVMEPDMSVIPASEVWLQQYSRVHIARPDMRYSLPWVDALPNNFALTIDEAQREVTVYSIDSMGMLTRQQIPLPPIWNWPVPYVNLIGATWAGEYWVEANSVPLLLVTSLIALLVGTYIYAVIVRPNRLSPRLTVWLLPHGRHLFAAAGYRGYRARWDAQQHLERFIWLFSRRRAPFTLATLVPALHDAGVACDEMEVELALSALGRLGVLRETDRRWTLVEPLLGDILGRDLPPDMPARLANTIRHSNPLYLETQSFFQDAQFDLQAEGDFGFRASSDLPTWRDRSPCYVRVVLERALDLDVVREIREASGTSSNGDNERLVLAAIDRAPRTGDLHQIFAARAQSGLSIVPLPLSLMRQARIERNALEALNAQVRLYAGQEDMYDVKTAVSDVLSFFGRQSQLADLKKRLTNGHSVMVYGVRKIGKSSLLHRLREEAGWPTAIVDAEGYTSGLSYIMDEALREWRAIIATEHPQLTLPDWNLGHYTDPGSKVQAFRQTVRAILDQLAQLPNKPGLLLFIDEMEYLYYKEPKAFAQIASILRSIAEASSRGRFAILVAGLLPDLNRRDYLDGTRNSFYSFFEESPLGPLELDDARTMVISLGGQMGVGYSDEALNCLVQAGGGHPLLTRQLCHFAIDRRTERPLNIDGDDANRAIRSYLWQPDNYLARSLWPGSRGTEDGVPDRDEAAILTSLAVDALTEADLLPATLSAAERDRRQEALARLKSLNVVRQDGADRWSITVPLYREWIRRTKLDWGSESDEPQPL